MFFSEDHQDALSELINISYGTATATIADLFDNFATLQVPSVEVTRLENIGKKVLEGFVTDDIYMATQNFFGEFHGEILFFIDSNSSLNMHSALWHIDRDVFEKELPDNEIKGSIIEVCNILTATCLGTLAELLKTENTFSPPKIEKGISKQVFHSVHQKQYEHIISIQTILEFQDVHVLGKLCILISEPVFDWLVGALDTFMDGLLDD